MVSWVGLVVGWAVVEVVLETAAMVVEMVEKVLETKAMAVEMV